METLVLRYILERMKDASLIKKYNEGLWYPNLADFQSFMKKQAKNNQNFSKLIKRYHLIKREDHIIETIFSEDLDSVSFYLEKKSTKIKSGYGTLKLPNNIPEVFQDTTCYISNGIFNDTKDLALKQVNNGSFIIGVCDNPNSIFYQENMKKIKELEMIFKKKHVPYRVYQHVNHRDKCYIISHRRQVI